MPKYPEDFINKIIRGDCLEVMRTFPDNCMDTIITDPPYGTHFMNEKWDYDVPSIEIWKECLRVLKPGGTALIFAGSRTQHRMAVNVEDAGFILKDTIMWLYGSGFPKATDISQLLDKNECRKQLEEKLGRKPTQKEFKEAWNSFRKVIIEKYRGKNAGKQSGIMGKTVERTDRLTEPATPEAILWNGWKSHGLKPAYEPILVCMKPNEGGYANNALKWGVAGLNIDGARISCNLDEEDLSRGRKTGQSMFATKTEKILPASPRGRYPTNIILDEEAGQLLDRQSGILKSGAHKKGAKNGSHAAFGKDLSRVNDYDIPSDSGGASRFFYCAKASRAEKNKGCEGLEDKPYHLPTNLNQERPGREGRKPMVNIKNNHPTVKPLALMKYLCTLTKTPTGGIVLDPFCGSGTTLMACKELKRDYIGIEKEAKYIEIARCRIKAIPETLF